MSYPIERQVCSLGQAKRLAELLGDDAPESLICWVNWDGDDLQWELASDSESTEANISLPAYTGDELGALLPSVIEKDEIQYYIRFFRTLYDNKFKAGYLKTYSDWSGKLCGNRGETEAQAKAALAIQGLEKDWFKKEDFNYGLS